MAKAPKMVNLSIEETSGVDHPAHLHEGWLVMKSADATQISELLDTLTSPNNDKEASMPNVNKATDERLEEALEALSKAEERIAELEKSEDAAPAAEEAPAETPAEEAPATEEAAPVADEAPAAEAEAETPAEEASEEEILKNAPASVVKMVAAIKATADEAVAKAAAFETELRKERESRADAEAIEKAKGYKHLSLDAEKIGKALRRLADMDSDLAKSVEGILESVNAQMESANIFAEIGKAAPHASGDAYSQVDAIAKQLVADGKATSYAVAFTKALETNPALYNDYLSEKGA